MYFVVIWYNQSALTVRPSLFVPWISILCCLTSNLSFLSVLSFHSLGFLSFDFGFLSFFLFILVFFLLFWFSDCPGRVLKKKKKMSGGTSSPPIVIVDLHPRFGGERNSYVCLILIPTGLNFPSAHYTLFCFLFVVFFIDDFLRSLGSHEEDLRQVSGLERKSRIRKILRDNHRNPPIFLTSCGPAYVRSNYPEIPLDRIRVVYTRHENETGDTVLEELKVRSRSGCSYSVRREHGSLKAFPGAQNVGCPLRDSFRKGELPYLSGWVRIWVGFVP